jgi:hypothetical protein
MSPKEMAAAALEALNAGRRVTMVRPSGMKMPPKFPRGELLCENHDGSRAYSHDPLRVLAWLVANGLVQVEAARGEGGTP